MHGTLRKLVVLLHIAIYRVFLASTNTAGAKIESMAVLMGFKTSKSTFVFSEHFQPPKILLKLK
jgi:hypothetical protein